MPIGAGKYDGICSFVRIETEAVAAIVLVIGGNRGSGFSVQTTNAAIQQELPRMLEVMAQEIRASLDPEQEGGSGVH